MPENRLLLIGARGEPACVDSLAGALFLAGQTTPEAIDQLLSTEISNAKRVIINFESSADGRGFSLSRHLRLHLGYQGTLYAAGDIIPDQVSMALDCGCDGVVVSAHQWERYGEENWLAGRGISGHLSYWSHSHAGENRAWNKRAVVANSALPL